jgi:general secretion pathway protein E
MTVMCEDKFAVASVVELVINQRLARRICSACSGAGCELCLNTGYKRAVPLVEWVRVNEPLRTKIRERGIAAIEPIVPLQTAAKELVQRGVTNEKEIRRVLG